MVAKSTVHVYVRTCTSLCSVLL